MGVEVFLQLVIVATCYALVGLRQIGRLVTGNDKPELGKPGIRNQTVGLELGKGLDSQSDVLLSFKAVQRDQSLLVTAVKSGWIRVTLQGTHDFNTLTSSNFSTCLTLSRYMSSLIHGYTTLGSSFNEGKARA